MGRSKDDGIAPQAYAYYRMPQANTYNCVKQYSSPTKIASLYEISDDKSGFLIAPFDVLHEDTYLIQPDNIITESIEELYNELQIQNSSHSHSLNECNTKESYNECFQKCKTLLENNQLNKIVLSHTFETQLSGPSPKTIFANACHLFPRCYVALWYTEPTGMWLTITPEILLERINNSSWHTVALAGTMTKPNSFNLPIEWSKKNKDEQNYVADYIENELCKLGIQSKRSELKTIEAAHLLHLCTDFYFNSEISIGSLLNQLHPTPAVCGMPKQEAYDAILSIEPHHRKYYAGFSGPIALKGQTHLFVTLRCAQCANSECFTFYAGGGLIKGSSLSDEWNEINAKMQTAYMAIS